MSNHHWKRIVPYQRQICEQVNRAYDLSSNQALIVRTIIAPTSTQAEMDREVLKTNLHINSFALNGELE